MLLKLRHQRDHASDYATSQIEVELMCNCHSSAYGGIAKRTGLTLKEGYACYRLFPSCPEHQEYHNALVVLTPDGFKFVLPTETHGQE